MKISIKKKAVKLRENFSYFLGSLDYLPYAEITVTAATGIVGKGEIACAIDVNGEVDNAVPHLAPYLENVLTDTAIRSEKDIIDAMSKVNLAVAFNAATKCGLEQALFAILAQQKQMSLASIFGQQKKSVKIQANISFLDSRQAYTQSLMEIVRQRPDHVKFKVGKDLALESWAIKQLRSLDKKVHINIDANQAFSSARAGLQFLELVSDVTLSWAEQLIHKDDLAGWAELKKKTKVPLMADESIHTSQDAMMFIQNGWVDLINVKLAKSGGIIEARKLIGLAKKHKVKVMLGSMLHGELGLKYNLAFALSQNFVTHGFYNYFSLVNYNRQQPLIDNKTLSTTKYVYSAA